MVYPEVEGSIPSALPIPHETVILRCPTIDSGANRGLQDTDAESERLTVLAETDPPTLGEWCRHVLLARAEGERPRAIEETALAEAFALTTIPPKSHGAARIAVIQ